MSARQIFYADGTVELERLHGVANPDAEAYREQWEEAKRQLAEAEAYISFLKNRLEQSEAKLASTKAELGGLRADLLELARKR